jgi:putative hydrolase of the HAD superfamily
MAIKAVLFDLDNTLIDFWTFKTKCLDAALKAMIKAGLKISAKKANDIIWSIHKKDGMEYKYIFQDFLKRVSGKVDYRILSHGLIAYRKAKARYLFPYPKVRDTIEKLRKKYKIAIISDAPREKAWERIVFMGIDNILDVVVTFDDTKKKKPSHAPFMAALKKLRLKPSEVLMVGDSISKDMGGAKALGMKTCLAVYGRKIKPKENPKDVDFMANRISDLLRIVRKV